VAPVITNLADLAEIGRGGFGIVYQARQVDLGRLVAVKVLPDVRGDTDAFGRFARECQALAALGGHPNIATVFGCGLTEDGAGYLSLELLTGGSLADRVTGGASDWVEVTAWGVALCGALETAHRAGITHRDIKPENVLFDGLGTPKLLDFGIAGVPGAFRTATGAVTLTLAHAAPEVVAGGRGGVPGDVYALASTLFAALAGGAAFVAAADETLVPMLARIATAPVPDLRPRGVPEGICAAIERAMAKDPAERPVSAEAFGMALRAAGAAQGVAVPAPPLLLVPGVLTGVGGSLAAGRSTGGVAGDSTLTGWVPVAPDDPVADPARAATSAPVARRAPHGWRLLAVAALALLGVLAWHGLDAPAPAQAGSVGPRSSPSSPSSRSTAPPTSSRPGASPTSATAPGAAPAPGGPAATQPGTPSATTAATAPSTPSALTPTPGPPAPVGSTPTTSPTGATTTSAPPVAPPLSPRQVRVSGPAPVPGSVGIPSQVALTLRWLPPTSGPVPSSYDLTWTVVGGPRSGTATAVVWSGTLSQRVTVPTPPAGTWYRWSVRARSGAATSAWVVSRAVVPSVIGRRAVVARALLQALGIASVVYPQLTAHSAQIGHVLAQSVPQGTVVPPRTIVALGVGKAA